LIPPAGRGPLVLIDAGSDGAWWQRDDGLLVRLSAPEREREPPVERGRVSLLGLLFAVAASGDER
jgi:hypothetical protein